MFLLIRPLHDALLTAQKLRQCSYEVFIEPLLYIRSYSIKDVFLCDHQKIYLNNHDLVYTGLLITSSNALYSIKKSLICRDIPIIIVGEKSAQLARNHGFMNILYIGHNIQEILAYMITYYANNNFIYLSGLDITTDITAVLKHKANITIKRIIVYRAVAKATFSKKCIASIIDKKITEVLFYSLRTAQIFHSITQKNSLNAFLQGMSAYSLSNKITNYLASFPYKNIHTALQPNADSLFSTILMIQKSKLSLQ